MTTSVEPSTHTAPHFIWTPAAGSPQRLRSLDVFRGITIAAMILVNNPGAWSAVYAPLRHAEWNGWTATDLVFPFFLFVVGVSMTLSFARRELKGDTRLALFKQVLRRSILIFAVGLFLNGFPYFELSRLRIPGVLQRIALCYLVAGIIYLTTQLRGQVITLISLLAGYWIVMKTVPVPGYGPGVLLPDGNLAAYIDNSLLHGHMYKATWDPEGLLSTLPAIATVLFGILTGHWLRVARTPIRCTLGLLWSGVVTLAAGQAMNHWFPINKNLWSSSYTVFTAGMALLIFGFCYWVIDVRGFRKWTLPFVVYGMNAITVYVLSSLMGKASVTWKMMQLDGRWVPIKTFVYAKFFSPLAMPINASLLFALAYVLLWMGIMWILYWRRVFIRI